MALPINRLTDAWVKTYGLIFTPKVRTTEAEGVSVPILALMVPTLPAAGAVTGLAGTVTAGLVAKYVVDAGVASLKTKPFALAEPLLVAVTR